MGDARKDPLHAPILRMMREMQQEQDEMPTVIQLTSNNERSVYEEAELLAREHYKGNIPFALSVLYGRLKNAGDSTSASIAFELLQKYDILLSTVYLQLYLTVRYNRGLHPCGSR